jgi:hypothetical protein
MESVFQTRDRIRDWASEWKSFYSDTVTETTIAEWLLQHLQPRAIKHAIRILEALHFASEPRLAANLKAAFSQLPPRVQSHGSFLPSGGLQDSGGPVGYAFAKLLGLVEKEFATREIRAIDLIPNEAEALILLDDNIASGTQLRDAVMGWMGQASTGEMGPAAIEPVQATLKSLPLYWLIAYRLGSGADQASADAALLGVDLRVVCAEARESTVFDAFERRDREIAQRTMASIGELLLEDKGWDESRRSDRRLGHGNLARTLVLRHNVPKSLLTTLWKFGRLLHGNWIPLFPERDEWRKYAYQIRMGNPYLRRLAVKLLDGSMSARVSALSARIRINGEEEQVVRVDFGRVDGLITPQVRDWIEGLRMTAIDIEETKNGQEDGYRTHIGIGSRVELPSARAIQNYNDAAERYNAELDGFEALLLESLLQASRSFKLELLLQNSGTAFARKIRVEVFLPPGDRGSVKHASLELPPNRPTRPEPRIVSAFEAGLGGIVMSPAYIGRGPSMDSIQSLIGGPSSQFSPYEEELDDGTRAFWWSIDELRHGDARQLLTLEYELADEVDSAEVTWKVHAEDTAVAVEGSVKLLFSRNTEPRAALSEALTRLMSRPV